MDTALQDFEVPAEFQTWRPLAFKGLTAGTRAFVEGHSNPTDEQLNIRATIRRRRGGDRVIKVSPVGRHQVQTSSRPLAERSRQNPAPSCVSPALQLKREESPWPEFGSDPGNPRELSKG